MKSIMNTFVVFAIGVVSTMSCSKIKTTEEISDDAVTVRFTSSVDATKTVFGENAKGYYPVRWTSDQKVAIFYNSQTGSAEEGYGGAQYITPTPSSDALAAEFSATFTKQDADVHTFYAFSPLCSLNWMGNEDWDSDGINEIKALYATVPADQVPVPGTCDEKAQLIVANKEYADFPKVVDLSFSHLSSYGKIKTLALPEGATEIVGFMLESNKAISGEIYYYFDQPANVHVNNKKATKYIYLNVNNAHRNTTLTDVFFATTPVSFSDGDWLKVSVYTTSDSWSKTIEFSSAQPLEFKPGHISSFSISAKGFTKL